MTPCPSCGTTVDTAADPICPMCGWAFEKVQARPATVIQPATRPKLPVDVSVGLGIDITGSSEPFATGIRGNINTFLRTIDAKAKSVTVSVQTHGDEDDGQFPTLIADAASVADSVAAVQALHFDGGGDPSEHHLTAIEQLAATLPVPAGAGRQRLALVFFTTADSKPARSGRTPEQIGAELVKQQLIVCLVGEPGTQVERVGRACGAFLCPIAATPSPADMTRVAEQVAASIVASLTKGTTRPLTQPVTT